jgi:hypothetical protein
MARFGAAIGIALFWLTLAIGGATAGSIGLGTHAWLNNAVTLYDGPGTEYDIVGDLADGIEVKVERCAPIWCRVKADGGRGWMYRRALSFGQSPNGMFPGEKFEWGAGAGTVCLYTGENYTGASLCRDSGFVMRDLQLYGNNDTYSSVTIEGSASVLLCRDRLFMSYCERVNESRPTLHGFLDNNISSVRIY